jgi:hypothetical protein
MAKKQKTKVTGAITSKYTKGEAAMRQKSLNSFGGTNYGPQVYNQMRKDPTVSKATGTSQNPGGYIAGLRDGSTIETSNIPMTKKTVRSLTTDGPKPSLQKSPMSGRDVPLPATSNKQLVKDAKSALKTARKTNRQSRRA